MADNTRAVSNVDPGISLSVTGGNRGPADPAGMTVKNPFELAGQFLDTQKKMNEIKLFNETFAAKQKLGAIMAEAPSIPAALEIAAKDPQVSAFVPDLAQTITSTLNIAQQYRGQVQSQTADAFTHAAALLPGLAVDPAAAKASMASWLNNIPDSGIKMTVEKSLGNIIAALDDPSLDQEGRMKAVTAASMMVPGTMEAMSKLWAQPTTIPLGDAMQPVTVQGPIPTILGRPPGDVQPAGNPLSMGLPPQVASPGGIPVGGRLGVGGPAPVQTQPGNDSPSVEPPLKLDGEPMVPEGYRPKVPDRQAGVIGGVPVGPAGEIAKGLAENFIGPEKHTYENSIQSLAMLKQMSHDFSVMANEGGFLVPGTAAEARVAGANLANTFARMIGSETPFSDPKIASAESIMKNTQRLGIGVLTSLLGTQREAASVIQSMTNKGVPGVSNSPLGAQLLTASIEQATQRGIDLYDFKNWWQAQTGGDLTGAENEFNRLNPANEYMQKALDQFGLTPQGFKDMEALDNAVIQGYISPKQAEDIARKQKL